MCMLKLFLELKLLIDGITIPAREDGAVFIEDNVKVANKGTILGTIKSS